MEFLSLIRRRFVWRNVLSGEKRRETVSFLSEEHKVTFNTRVKKKHLMEEGGIISARLARPLVSHFSVCVVLSVINLSQTDWVFIHPFVRL